MMKRAAKFGFFFFSLGLLLVFFLKGSGIQVPTDTWAPSGNMAEARSGASSVLLQDGTILVAGGEGASGVLASAEFFSAGSFASAPAMNVARSRHAAVVLQDGRVLVTGGKTTGGGVTNAAEIYSPALNSWIVIASMADARSGHTATLLEDGRVLLAGGEGSAAAVSTLELFYPGTGTFEVVGMMSSARMNHATALLAGARVLIAGGSNGSMTLASSEIFNAETNTLDAGPALSGPRAGLSATTLLDGKVLLAGGNNGTADLTSAEIYNPATGTISVLGSSLAAARRDHLAFLLPNNSQVLIVGGTSAGAPLSSAELFRPWTGAFQPTGSLVATRSGGTGSALSMDGLLLVAGGGNQATSELYGFATVKTDKDDYAPGEIVTITGGGWQPGETVTLLLHEANNPEPHGDRTLTAVADSAGNILNKAFAPEQHDIGVRFYLTASGSNSQVQTTFTDDTNITSATVTIHESTCTTPTNTFTQGQTVCAGVNITGVGGGGGAGNFFILWVNPSAAVVQTTTKTVPATVPTAFTDTLATTVASPIGTWTVKVCKTAACTGGNLVASAPFTLRTPTTTSVASSLNPSTYGTGVSFTATVTRPAGSGTPTGSVQFKVDGSNSGSPVALGAPATATSATAVSASISTLTAGTHTVEAVYIPTGAFGASTGTLSPVQTVNQKALTISFTADNKVYDGTTAATILTRTLGGVIGPDVITPGGGTATFADRNVGTGKTVTGTGFTLSGSAAANYTISPNSATTIANITQKHITGSFTADNKVYDGNTSATVLTRSLTGVVGTDAVTLTAGTATFADGNVGNGKTVTLTGATLGGGDAGNYVLDSVATTTANITRRTLTVSATGINKIYDGNTNATVTLADDRVLGDVLTVSATASFADVNVGIGKTVTVSGISISGADAGNYLLSSTTTSTTADITPRPTMTLLSSSLDSSVTPVKVNLTATVTATPLTPTTGSVTFTDGASVLGTVALTLTSGGQATLSTASLAVGQHVITAIYNPSPNFGMSGSAPNTAPNATITGPPTGSVQAVNTTFNFTATFTDATGNTPNATAAWSFDAISVAGVVSQSSGSGTVTKSYQFSNAGVYAVRLTLNDNLGGITIANTINPDNLPAMVVAYDPSGGFVTGGGWIVSPSGAYVPNPSLTGKANFGFVSKYQKGATVPTGDTEFQFHAGNLNFKSTTYDWLVIGGARAQYKGLGTINGTGNYGFILTAIDGQISGGGGTDKFRMKICDKDNLDTIIYDNMPDALDGADPTTVLGGGSIVIHSK